MISMAQTPNHLWDPSECTLLHDRRSVDGYLGIYLDLFGLRF